VARKLSGKASNKEAIFKSPELRNFALKFLKDNTQFHSAKDFLKAMKSPFKAEFPQLGAKDFMDLALDIKELADGDSSLLSEPQREMFKKVKPNDPVMIFRTA
jgi:hypothetical protein